jgi:uncharacterized protein GlcG (DUF336 family)
LAGVNSPAAPPATPPSLLPRGGRIVPVPGGVPIRDKAGEIIGAVGISGDTSDNDETCAIYGVKCAGLVPDAGDPA